VAASIVGAEKGKSRSWSNDDYFFIFKLLFHVLLHIVVVIPFSPFVFHVSSDDLPNGIMNIA
jgi:hypothetical protein